MVPLNEYHILRIIKNAFESLKTSGSDFDNTFTYLFDALDLDDNERNTFKDIIINDKIQYHTSYSNLSTVLPVITCVVDQETILESGQGLGGYLGETTVEDDGVAGEEYGTIMQGVYSINILGKQILLVRLLGSLVRFILQQYSITHDDMADLDINTDRFSPDAEYFPNDVYHIHLIVRFKYVESWPEIFGEISQIILTGNCFDGNETIVPTEE